MATLRNKRNLVEVNREQVKKIVLGMTCPEAQMLLELISSILQELARELRSE